MTVKNAATVMNVMDTIYARRAIRVFTSQPLWKEVIQALLEAAVHAPTARHLEPWAFVVVNDQTILQRLSEHAKAMMRQATPTTSMVKELPEHIFYHAPTLVVICGHADEAFTSADCWLAAENLMLAACGMGLGSCVIGFAVAALNMPEWKKVLHIPDDMNAIAPIIIGYPDEVPAPSTRKEPKILAWL